MGPGSKGRRGPPANKQGFARLALRGVFPFLFVCLSAAVFFRRGGLAATPVNKHPGRGVLETDCGTSLECGLVGEGGSALAAAAGEPLFLFIGILSGRGYRHRRLAVRESWSGKAQIPGVVVSKFVLSEDERTPQVEKEVEAYDDVIFVKEATNYKSILFKTFFVSNAAATARTRRRRRVLPHPPANRRLPPHPRQVMEYAVRHYDVKFVLKTDDDAFIHVTPMVHQLRALCETPGCAQERLYIGKMATSSEVLLQPGHKWNNEVFHNHTGEHLTLLLCASHGACTSGAAPAAPAACQWAPQLGGPGAQPTVLSLHSLRLLQA
jgi:hypothetical protein